MFFPLLILCVIIYANIAGTFFSFDPAYCLYPDNLNYYFLKGLTDAQLFAKDAFMEHFRSTLNQNPSYSLNLLRPLYLFFVGHFGFIATLKTAGVALAAVSCALIYRTGLKIQKDPAAARLLCALFCVYFLSMDSFYHGVPRSFGATLVCLYIYLYIAGARLYLPVLSAASVFIYPPVTPMLWTASALALFVHRKEWPFEAKRAYAVLLALASAVLLWFACGVHAGVSLSHYNEYKFLHAKAFAPAFPGFLRMFSVFFLNLDEHSALFYAFTALFLIFAAVSIFRRRAAAFTGVPREIAVLLAASVLSFLAVLPFSAPTASRQLVLTLPLALVFLTAANIRFPAGSRLARRIYSALIIVFLAAHPALNDVYCYAGFKPVYDYFSSKGRDILIAGDPRSGLVHSLPVFSGRPVFCFQDMRDFPFDKTVIPAIRAACEANTEFMRAGTLDEARKFIEASKPDYVVVERLFRPDPADGKDFMLSYAAAHSDLHFRRGWNDIYIVKAESYLDGGKPARSSAK